MVKSPFISVISKKENIGSVEFQIFSFTSKIRKLTSHLKLHKKDSSSRSGLQKNFGKRQPLLTYLLKRNIKRYKELISKFAVREKKNSLILVAVPF